MTKDKQAAPRKPGKAKKIMLISVAVLALTGAGAGAGLYASGAGLVGSKAKPEDPNRPKLVERSDEPAEPAGEGGHGADAAPPPRVGTVSVKSDTVKVDPRKYAAAYYSIEQSFTANLADGSGFVQAGLSVSTYYDSRVFGNVQRHIVPIRSAILMVLSDQDAAVIATPAGKQRLQRQLKDAINTVLREKEGFGGIDNVYFSNLVIQ
jgi:flagellar protein FliL